ncbi:hypothetical protein DFJ43DRAFT_1092245 [Lentinula guzmanii]|uniref:Serine protease n=1 Tax=Lentinula guzmanii TaxID=2804957 RepID=A0AA38JAJ8_9AGAR|nr:hypothetical protein DFJ43DRAFT_1092245 [Lentinula guzmanii]
MSSKTSNQRGSTLGMFIVDLTDEELTTLSFLGPEATEPVKRTIKAVKKVKDHFNWLTVFQLQCLQVQSTYHPGPSASPTSPYSNPKVLSDLSETTVIDPESISLFERVHFYTGISDDPPHLFQRSDVYMRPFVIPDANERHSAIPEKTAHGVVDIVLTAVHWKETVAPEIINLLKDEKYSVNVSTMVPVRFSIPDENGKPVFESHIVIWISIHPGTTTEASCRDANPDILAILSKHGVQDVAVHWIEGAPERLVGPEMMQVVDDTDPTAWIRRAMTAVLGVPLAAQGLSEKDAQGSLGIFFHEGKNKTGEESKSVFAITNKHVVSHDITSDYDFGRPGAPKQWIRNCGRRRFEKVQDEARAFIAQKLSAATLLAEQLAALVTSDENAANKRSKKLKEQELERLRDDLGILEDFFRLLNSTWSDAYHRFIGWLDWAPKIRNDVDKRCYTRDIGVIQLDKAKWEKNFRGNFVYLGGKFTSDEIIAFFHPNHANPPSFKYPANHLFKLQGVVPAEGLATPHFYDEQGSPCFIVAKEGQSTDLTFGRFSELEAYTCNEFKQDSWEVAVFNYDRKMGNFSFKGDSGSCIFNAEGKMVAFLHSGMPRGMSNHVTFGAPAHFIIEEVKKHYPSADFDREVF